MKEVKSSSLKVGDLFKWTTTHGTSDDVDEWIGLVVKKTNINNTYFLGVYTVCSTWKNSPSIGKINHYNLTIFRPQLKFYLFDKES